MRLTREEIEAFARAFALYAVNDAKRAGNPLTLDKLDLVGLEETELWAGFSTEMDYDDSYKAVHKRMYEIAREVVNK